MTLDWLAQLGAMGTVAMGLLGLFKPTAAAKLVAIVPVGKLGISELRATYGGLFVGLGACMLWLNQPPAYLVGACAWILIHN